MEPRIAPVPAHLATVIPLPGDAALAAGLARLVPDGADHVHAWPGGGISWFRTGAAGTAVAHTWPEHGLASLDLYGAAAVAAFADLGWAPVASVAA